MRGVNARCAACGCDVALVGGQAGFEFVEAAVPRARASPAWPARPREGVGSRPFGPDEAGAALVAPATGIFGYFERVYRDAADRCHEAGAPVRSVALDRVGIAFGKASKPHVCESLT